MYRQLVTGNIILRKRLEGIGPISVEMCRKYGATGPVIRGSGVAHDVRKTQPYSVYPEFDFSIPVYPECDCMARYLVRMDEMEQSLRIIEQALGKLPDGPVTTKVRACSSFRPATTIMPSRRRAGASPCASSAMAKTFPIASSCARPPSPT